MAPLPIDRRLAVLLRRSLLGPTSTFRNNHRAWLYGGFILMILIILVILHVEARAGKAG